MYRTIFWLIILAIITFIGIFFEPINVRLNPGQTYGTVIQISEWMDINQPGYGGIQQRNYKKTFNVTYYYTVNGKSYEGKRKMKVKWSLDPKNPGNSKDELGPADVAPITIVYCKHWPSFHIIKD